MPVSILFYNFAIATILMRSTPHKQRARIYVQARPTYLLRLWAYFFAHNCRIKPGARPLFMRSTPHSVEMQKLKYTAVRLPRVFIALCGGKHKSCSRRGSASRFFRTPTSTVPGGSRDKATTLILCKQLHQSSARLSCARWASARLRSRLGSTQRAK